MRASVDGFQYGLMASASKPLVQWTLFDRQFDLPLWGVDSTTASVTLRALVGLAPHLRNGRRPGLESDGGERFRNARWERA